MGAVAVTLVLVHIIVSFMMRRYCKGKGKNYISSLYIPNVPYYHQTSSNVEEEALLLSDLSRSQDDCATWENEENDGEDKDSINSDRQPLTDHHSSAEL